MNDLLAQLIWNGLVAGSLLALVSLGLTLIYGIAGFVQFAHGELVALGAYGMLIFHKFLGWEIFPAGVASVACVIFFGIFLEKILFRPVRKKNPLVPLVISIGLSILLQSLILIFFGPQIQTISDRHFESFSVAGKFLATPNQLCAVVAAVILTAGLIFFLKKTRRGQSLRAVSDNRNLAQIFGVNIDSAMRWIFGVSAGLAAVAGIFLGFERNLEPMMGVQISITAFAAVILGSLGSVRGAIFGALTIGFAENLLVGFGVIPSGFSSAIPFLVLIGILLVRPTGFFGKSSQFLRE
ncbi:branched-chain amino acid ABC transporter permease [bacterium]|mgnify:CR=1 FL=1|jgi:branched-chain amino acid transport system permease protein|nr:branched-chain amino acid ABC transporter permease [bacterium]MBT6831514.1 branched-chain amino acid ABC transporter permease [bacterium]MBT6996164.1 branched-chain amino acid ABC transporter permease [bacterium]MBT7772547.1 branched-chain amino acid ABC transporter permease [bacterium]